MWDIEVPRAPRRWLECRCRVPQELADYIVSQRVYSSSPRSHHLRHRASRLLPTVSCLLGPCPGALAQGTRMHEARLSPGCSRPVLRKACRPLIAWPSKKSSLGARRSARMLLLGLARSRRTTSGTALAPPCTPRGRPASFYPARWVLGPTSD